MSKKKIKANKGDAVAKIQEFKKTEPSVIMEVWYDPENALPLGINIHPGEKAHQCQGTAMSALFAAIVKTALAMGMPEQMLIDHIKDIPGDIDAIDTMVGNSN